MSDETTLADRGDDVTAMSDEELVEALETLAEQVCRETGYATVPVKLHGLEIRHRLENLRERVEELEVIVEAVCQLDADHYSPVWRDSQELIGVVLDAAGRIQDLLNTLGTVASDARQALQEDDNADRR